MSESADRSKDAAGLTEIGRPAAFFDVDGTLLTVQSGLLYIQSLRRSGLMGLSDVMRIYWGYLTYRLGVMNIARLAEVTSQWLVGRTEESVIEHARSWYRQDVCQHYCAAIVERLEEHRRSGHVVALLTSGTRYLTDWVCEDLELDHAIATRVEVVDGRFTGRAVEPFCYGRGKVYWADKFVAEQGIDLAASYFYTDSIVDLPMLECVGHPQVVNPDPRLRAEAKRRGWPLIDDTRTVHISAPRRAA